MLLLGTVWSTRKLNLHAFEHAPLFSNVEEEFGNGSSFELPKSVEKPTWLTLIVSWLKCEKDGPLREFCFSQWLLSEQNFSFAQLSIVHLLMDPFQSPILS